MSESRNQKLVQKLDRGKVTQILKRIPLFKKLSETEINMILDMPKSYLTFTEGEVIMEENEKDDSFFILLHGEAAVWRKERVIATVSPPNFLGEVGFIVGDPRIATVTANSDHVVAMKITAYNFKALNSHIRECIKDKIIEGLVLRLKQTTDAMKDDDIAVCLNNKLADKYAGGETY